MPILRPPPDLTTLAKPALRQQMRAALAELSPDAVAQGSAQLLAALFADAERWCPVGATVALFGGIAGEPDLLPLIPWLAARNCRAAVFNMEGGELVPYAVRDATQLERVPFGVWVPRVADCERIAASELSVILVPGLAFSRIDRQRLGRGRGFYDKLLARSDVAARSIGIGFACQLVERVPCEPHDVALDEVRVAGLGGPE